MTLPALDAVGEAFPSSVMCVVAKPWVAPVYAHHPAVDRVMVLNKGEGTFSDVGEFMRCVRRIREERFDLAILFQNAFEAALLTFLGGVRFRLGYRTDGRGFLLTHGAIRNKEVLGVHQTEYYLSILRGMGWKAENRVPTLAVSPSDREAADTVLRQMGVSQAEFLLGLAPGAVFGGAKRWPAERFAEIGDMAVQRWGARVVLLGSSREASICERVRKEMRSGVMDLSGRTSLGVAMGVIGRCSFLVCNDSGLMHVAAALGLPTLAVFGPTDPVATGPRGPRVAIVRHDTSCAPCLKPECTEDHACMLGVQPKEVWEAMEALREGIS